MIHCWFIQCYNVMILLLILAPVFNLFNLNNGLISFIGNSTSELLKMIPARLLHVDWSSSMLFSS
jgi:hypothetical protein